MPSSASSATYRITTRPLPRLPSVTSIHACVPGTSFSSTLASPSSGAHAFPRPLPTPPQRPAPSERSRANSSISSHIRPLPVPQVTCPAPPSSLTEDVALSYLRVDIPDPPSSNHFIESPLSPSTPLIFSTEACSASSSAPSLPETSAKATGYVHVEPTSEETTADSQDDSSSESVCLTQPLFTKKHLALHSAQSHHNVHITVELVPSRNYSQRGSRVWMRERKGRRWVEDDYAEILRELRRL